MEIRISFPGLRTPSPPRKSQFHSPTPVWGGAIALFRQVEVEHNTGFSLGHENLNQSQSAWVLLIGILAIFQIVTSVLSRRQPVQFFQSRWEMQRGHT
jgi:hypothetical protein